MKTLPNYDLMKEVESEIRKGNSVEIRLVGNSMLPFLHEDRDILTVGPCSSKELRRGEVVLANFNGQYFLHRITQLKQDKLILCGDANYNSFEIINEGDIIGFLRSIEHDSGRITFCSEIRWRIQCKIWMMLYPIRRYLLFCYRLLQQ